METLKLVYFLQGWVSGIIFFKAWQPCPESSQEGERVWSGQMPPTVVRHPHVHTDIFRPWLSKIRREKKNFFSLSLFFVSVCVSHCNE